MGAGIEPARLARRGDPGRGGGHGRGTYGPARAPWATFQQQLTTMNGRKSLLCKGFSVERVTGIEPAWPAWKASGTGSRLSVKMAVDLRISVFDLDRCGP